MRSLRRRLVKTLEERRVSGEFGEGLEQGTSTRVAVEDEVRPSLIFEDAGLDHGGQGLLGRRDERERLIRNVSALWDTRPELELSTGAEAARI